jgi:hypothetical protein
MAPRTGPLGTDTNQPSSDAGTTANTQHSPNVPAGCGSGPCTGTAPAPQAVYVVKASMTKMDDSIIDSACNLTKTELDSVFTDEKKRITTRVFTVKRGTSGGTGSGDYTLFLLRKSDTDTVWPKLKQYLPGTAAGSIENARDSVVSQLKKEGGAAIQGGNVCFVALDLYEADSSTVPTIPGEEDSDDADDTKVRTGIYLAGMMLHELGHCMGANHDTGIMAEKEDMTTTGVPKPLHYSPHSRKQIQATFAAKNP